MIKGFHQTKHLKAYWFRLLNTYFLSIIFGSLAFLFLGFGYELNGRGFQGIMSHPQNFGPVVGIISAYFVGMLLSQRRLSKLLIATIAICIVFVFMSLARTGMVALLLGGGIAYLFSFRKAQNKQYAAKGVQLLGLSVTALLLFVLSNPTGARETLTSFVQKREDENVSTNLNDLFTQSRGNLAVSSLDNFRENPIFGIGFGVPSNIDDSESLDNIRYVGSIPVSASVEKGFLPSAILEELGLIGGFATLILLAIIFGKVRNESTFPMFWVLTTAVLINIGEAVFYSIGGTGFFMWMVVAFCYNLDFYKSSELRYLRAPRFKRRTTVYD